MNNTKRKKRIETEKKCFHGEFEMNTEKVFNGQLLVSIATPFHNTDLNLFRQCMNSVLNQTLGFDRMEWVITLHNSEPEYVSAVREMTRGYANIHVFELYNDWHTASTPRNNSLDHACGKYVFFLDSDDYIYPDAMQKLYEQMEAHDAQIGVFRLETTPGTQDSVEDYLRVKTLFDQTKPLIVLHREDPDMDKYIVPINLGPTKMYLLSFLRGHDIHFPQDVRIGEDMTFNLNCLCYVKTIVYLPQYIGYRYQMNVGSLTHTMGVTNVESMLSTLNDRFHWLEMAAKTGLDASSVGWIAMVSAVRLLANPALPADKAAEWKAKYAPYCDKFLPMKGNDKFIPQERAEGIMQAVKGFFSSQNQGEKVNRNTDRLFEILRANADTDMGVKYRFNALRTYEAFSKNVPLSDYGFYQPLVELTTRIGETNIFCKEPLVGYALSSGSSGPAKRVPYTLSHLQTYAGAMQDILMEKDATFALLESLPKESEYADKTRLDSICGAVLSVIRQNVGECSYSKQFKRGVLTSPAEILFPEETIDPRYPRLLFALMEKNVGQIVAPFTWGLLDIMQYFEKNQEELLRDIENGTVSKVSRLPEPLRQALEAKMRPDPKRAEVLRREVAKGFDGIVPRIWPKCGRVVSVGTGAFAFYRDMLRRYTGDIPFNNGFFATSEALIGRNMGDETDEYALSTDSAFFEFLEPGGTGEPVDAEHIECGKDYEIILTNDAGLYRYRLGDVINIHRVEQGVPIFAYEYRMDEQCDLAGVPVNERDLSRAAGHIAEKTNAEIRDFCAMSEENRLVFFAEPAPNDMKAFMNPGTDVLASWVDESLCAANGAYALGRKTGAIQPPVFRVLQPETHLLYRDRRLFREKLAPDQIKPVRVLGTEEKKKFFLTLTEM